MKENKSQIIRKILFDQHRKSLWQIYKDIKWIKNKSPFKDKSIKFYFECLAYKKDAGKLENYLPTSVYLRFKNDTPICQYHGKHPILGDKTKFKEFALKNNLPVAKHLGYIKNGFLKTVNTQELIDLNKQEEIKKLVNNWLNEHKVIFIKESDTWSGLGVKKVSNWESFSKINFKKEKNYLIEEKITQKESLNKINPNCVIGLRVITVLKDNNPIIMGCHLRTGYGNSFLDTDKGLNVRYNIYENKLDKLGHQRWVKGGKSYNKQPFTNFKFENQPLPYPDKIIELVKYAASLFPDQRLIGWDIAFTEQGPLIVEGNDSPAIVGMQMSFKGLLSNLYFRELYEEYFNENGTLKISLA